MMRLVFADEACPSTLSVCVYVRAPRSLMTLVFADEASESVCMCVFVVCGAA